MDWLKDLLGEELFKQVKEKLGDTKVIKDDGNFIPKSRFDEVNNSKKEMQKQVDDLKEISSKYEQLQKDMANWKDQAEQVPALKKKMEEWENQAKDLEGKLGKANEQIQSFSTKEQEYQAKLKDTQINSTIEKLLLQNNAKYPDLILGKFDRTKLELADDGTVKGADEQLKTIQEQYKELFGEVVITGGNPGGGGNPKPIIDHSKMSDADYLSMRMKDQK
ncbi:phage scaffolding protein [Anaerosolibacter sp.]|uniref:phage scaffolding protein n=1 Tax=Anaerosolibacter sp. TaxID=1872527 RepID=UPI0039EEDB29